jgi:hypothetical protein
MIPLSQETRNRLRVLFPGPERDEAERLLVESCGHKLPLCEGASPESMERIRYAAMKLSGGDLVKLRDAIGLAIIDWRDLLVAAGFADDVLGHRSWNPAAHLEPEGT